jgi:Tol biopolymer transport system component
MPTPQSRHFNPLEGLLGVQTAEAHGAPWELWSIGLDGTGLRRLTVLYEDLPYPAWSADSKSVLFLGIGGVYRMNADGTNLKRLTDGFSHGELDWYSR